MSLFQIRQLFSLIKMLPAQPQHHRRQQEYRNEVGDGHKPVEGLADAPDQAEINDCAHNGDQAVGNVEGQH